MVSLKLLLIKTVEDIEDFDYSYIISCIRNAQVTFVKKPAQLNIISFYKRWDLIHSRADKAFKVNILVLAL